MKYDEAAGQSGVVSRDVPVTLFLLDPVTTSIVTLLADTSILAHWHKN